MAAVVVRIALEVVDLMRLFFDPLIWFGLMLPLVMTAEWIGAVRSGHVGPALFAAGCLLALPLLARLALSPNWFSDLLVILAGLALL